MCTGGEQRSDKNKCSLNFCANTQGNQWSGFNPEEEDKNAPGMKCFKTGEGNKGYKECRKVPALRAALACVGLILSPCARVRRIGLELRSPSSRRLPFWGDLHGSPSRMVSSTP